MSSASVIMLPDDTVCVDGVGSSIKGYQKDIWMNKIPDITQTVVYLYIWHNPWLKAKLCPNGHRIMGEATSDYIWGIQVEWLKCDG